MGVTEFVLRYEQPKPKYAVLEGFPVVLVTCYVTKMTASCSAILDFLVKLVFDMVFVVIRTFLLSVETGLSLLKYT